MDHKELLVTCYNEDDGAMVTITGTPNDDVRAIVAAMFANFKLDRRPGDRLRCEVTGDDVFTHLEDKLEAYRATRCHELVWLFSADQGGALR